MAHTLTYRFRISGFGRNTTQ